MKKLAIIILSTIGILNIITALAIVVIIKSNNTDKVINTITSSFIFKEDPKLNKETTAKSHLTNIDTDIILTLKLDRMPKTELIPVKGDKLALPFIFSSYLGVNKIEIIDFQN